MFQLHRTNKTPIKPTTELALIRIIIALSLSGIDTIWAIYMDNFGLNESTIGFISAALIIVSLITSFYSTIILEKLSEYKVLLTSLLLYSISFISIKYLENLLYFISISIIITIISVFRINSFNILFKDEADKGLLNEEEGFLYTLLNISWLVGPLIAGLISATYGLNYVFLSSGIFMLLGFLVLKNLKNLKIKKNKKNIDRNILKNLKNYFKRKELIISYVITTGIEIWWALIYIYIPLFIIKKGLSEGIVGIFLSVAMTPLVILEYKFSKLSTEKGFKKLLIGGFTFIAIISFIAFSVENIYYQLLLMIIASFGMAAIEPLEDTFFFKQINSNEEEKFYPIYGTALQTGGFIGKISIATILLFLPDKYAYIVIGILMLLIAGICTKIKE